MKFLILLVMSVICAVTSLAQNVQIKGKVIDGQSKSPLEGANINVNGSTGVVTDKNGEFTIKCNDTILVAVSFIGFNTVNRTLKCEGTKTQLIELHPVVEKLHPIEITTITNSNKSQLEQPLSIVKIEKRALKRATGLYLADAINTNAPGVTMQRRTQSGGQQINIRGYGSGMGFRGVSNNFDNQGIKMYLNGIPLTDAEGITLADDIDFGSVTEAEILKGPSGTLYGLAIAGVINLKTELAEKNETSVGQEVIAGSYGLLRTTTRLNIGGKRSSLLLSYGRQQFDGFMPHTKSNKDFVNLIENIHLNDRQEITVYFGYANSYDERNGELTINQYDSLDYSGNAKYIKNNAHSAVKTFRSGISHSYRFNNNFSNTTSFFGSSQNMDNSSAGGWTDKLPLNYGIRSVFEKRFQLTSKINLSGTTGLEAQKTNAQVIGYKMGPDSTNIDGYNIITSLRSNQSTSTSTYSYFTQWSLSLPFQLSLTAGAGVSNMKISLEDRLWGLTNNSPANKRLRLFENSYRNLVSPIVALNKKISKMASVYASWSTGYKAPVSSNILISTTGELNTGLKPEKGTQLELGTKGSFRKNRLFYTVAIFNTNFEDKFTTITVQNPDNTATLYSYVVNGGRMNNKGLELLLNYKVIESESSFIQLLQPFANFTFSDFKYEDYRFEKIVENITGQDRVIVEDYSGKYVAGVAPLVLNVGIDMTTKAGFYGNLHFNYRSSMPFTSDGLNKAREYNLLNAKLGFRKTIRHIGLDIYAGVNNITGNQYYNMVFVNQLPDAFIPAPSEINFFGGANLRYIF